MNPGPRRDGPMRAARVLATVLPLTAIALGVMLVVLPWLRTPGTYGFQDWDVAIAQRALTRLSLLRFGEFPAWNPYACGGFPSWGYAEGAPTVVSPWLPFYLALPVTWALRVEVLGMGLLGAAGAYVLAGRFTASTAARALVAVVWAANGRWALQIAAGHTWHLAFAWTPWCFYFFERARVHPWRVGPLTGLASCLALQLYAGGIYPLPHTVLALGLYAIALGLVERTWRPLAVLSVAGVLAIGLAAPKLLPVLDTFARAPREVGSTEVASLGALWTALTSRAQGFAARPAEVPAYGWHEWGIYVGRPALLAITLGLILVRERRAVALAGVGAVFFALGLGAVGRFAPWTLLHTLPVFRSHHVPARFQYTAVLMFALAASSGLGRWLQALETKRAWSAAVAGALVLLIALDIASVARQPMGSAMVLTAPVIPARARFHQVRSSPWHYEGPHAWVGGPEYLAMEGNAGVLDCYSAPPFAPRGARAAGEPGFRGDAWMEGGGIAEVRAWSPDRVVIDVRGATPGARVVYNGNAARGWTAQVTPAQHPSRDPAAAGDVGGALAIDVPAGDASVVFTYRPPRFTLGIVWAVLTMVVIAAAHARWRRP